MRSIRVRKGLTDDNKSYLEAHHQLTFYLSSEYLLLAEIDVISEALSGKQ